MSLSRRRFLGGLAALAGSGVRAAPSARVVVIGAGFGGATCARYLTRLCPEADVLLVDARTHFLTGPGRNLVMAGLRRRASLTVRLARIGRASAVRTLCAAVTRIDPATRQVLLADGRRLEADLLVVAPGIALRFGAIEGLDAASSPRLPHAWIEDDGLDALVQQLAGVRNGDTLLIGAPPNPYRCPPGPYERASLLAYHLKATQRGRCKILIADAKDDFSKSALFKLEWDLLYPGMIEWRSRAGGGEIVRVDAQTRQAWLRGESAPLRAALISLIPAQQAGAVAARSALTDESGWCPVHADSFESTQQPNVFVLGDAAIAAPMPKSAFSANSQAKLCAASIAARLNGEAAPAPQLLNTCYSYVSDTQAISVSGLYAAVNGRLSAVHEGMSPLSAGVELREAEARQAHDWYAGITADSFGRRPA